MASSKPKSERPPRAKRRAARGPGGLTSAGDIVASLVRKTPLGPALEYAKIWERWPDIAGPTVCHHVRPVTVRDGELVVEADSAVWMHKVNLKKWQIVKRVNLMAGRELVHGVYVALHEAERGE